MALIFCDGFDHYATADILKKWTSIYGSTNSPATITGSGRRGSNCLYATGTFGSGFIKVLSVNAATLIAGFALIKPNYGGSTVPFVSFYDGGTEQFGVGANGSGAIIAIRSGTVIGTSTATGLVNGGFNYVEVKVTFHGTAGSVEARINGVSVLTLTGINTKVSANAYANGVSIQKANNDASPHYFDDFYVCDATGATSNDFLGDIRIDTLLPNADGAYSQFTPNSGTTHYTKVADAAPDTTSYNYSGTVGQKDTYQFADLASVTGTIKAVQVTTAAMKDDSGTRQIANLIKSGSNESQGTSAALSTSQSMVSTVYEGNPATGYDPGSHRYWRVYITSAQAGNPALTEIYFRTTSGGAAVTTGGTVINNNFNIGSFPASNAFDGSTTSGTFTGTTPCWLGYDFGAGNSKRIVEFAIMNPYNSGFSSYNTAPGTYSLDYSDDGTTWTTAKSITGDTWTSYAEVHTWAVTTSGGAWTEAAINALEAGVIITG